MIASRNMLPRASTAPSMGERLSIAAAGSLACAALALWVSFGSLTFIDTGRGAPYIGLLPPWWWLAVLLAGASLIAVVVRPSPSSVAPCWLSAVALLPWLPFRMPLAVFVWTG